MTRSHFSSSILTASVKSTSGGRAAADSIITETERREQKITLIQPVTQTVQLYFKNHCNYSVQPNTPKCTAAEIIT
jgi:pectate lyase